MRLNAYFLVTLLATLSSTTFPDQDLSWALIFSDIDLLLSVHSATTKPVDMDELTLPYDILRFDYKERLSDRFLTTYLHRFEMFSKPVAIIVLIEIINPWHPSSELGQKIINTLIREFLQGEAQSYLTRFETTLKQANRIIKESSLQIESPVSCLAVLLEADQVHCASIGTAKLGLLRHGRYSTILGTKNSSTETFTAVTSGDMNQDDWLFIANEAFYSLLAEQNSQSWLLNDVASIGTKISQQNQLNKKRGLAGVLLHYETGKQTVSQTFLWDEASPSSRVRSRPDFSRISANESNPLVSTFKRVIGSIGSIRQKIVSRRKH